MRVLLLEDDDVTARSLLRIFDLLQHEVVHVTASDAARLAFDRNPSFDLVIADSGVGEATGADFLAWVAQRRPELRRVLVSGARPPSSFVEDRPRQWFQAKPFGLAELQEMLASP